MNLFSDFEDTVGVGQPFSLLTRAGMHNIDGTVLEVVNGSLTVITNAPRLQYRGLCRFYDRIPALQLSGSDFSGIHNRLVALQAP